MGTPIDMMEICRAKKGDTDFKKLHCSLEHKLSSAMPEGKKIFLLGCTLLDINNDFELQAYVRFIYSEKLSFYHYITVIESKNISKCENIRLINQRIT